jgi:hypothetical protein
MTPIVIDCREYKGEAYRPGGIGRSALSKLATYCWLAASNSLATGMLEIYASVQVKMRRFYKDLVLLY